MAKKYGELLKSARANCDPPLTAKGLADRLNVKAPFITDIEKGRRLPSLENQEKIKKLLANDEFPPETFDDLAAGANEDPRIVAKDIAAAIRKRPALCELIREIAKSNLSAAQIRELSGKIGGYRNPVQ